MDKRTITFRMDLEKMKALDAIASSQDRDRSYILNEAVRSYLSMNQWQIAHIKEGVRQAKKGEFASEREVSAAFSKWAK